LKTSTLFFATHSTKKTGRKVVYDQRLNMTILDMTVNGSSEMFSYLFMHKNQNDESDWILSTGSTGTKLAYKG